MKISALATLTTMLLFLTSIACKKEATTPGTTGDIDINISSPREGEAYKPGDTVHIRATVEAQYQLHGYIVRIYYGDSVLFDTEGHSHSNQLNIDEKWVNLVNMAAELQLEISTVIDHNGNTKKVKKTFKSQP